MSTRLVIFIFLIMLTPTTTWACSQDPAQPEPTDRDFYKAAKLVLSAHVTKVEEMVPAGDGDGGLIVGTLRPIEVFKGKLPQEFTVRSEVFLPGNCTLPLMAGSDYVFFLDGKDNFVQWATGSRSYFNIDGTEVRKELEAIRALKKLEP
jgi:hypothetical protein